MTETVDEAIQDEMVEKQLAETAETGIIDDYTVENGRLVVTVSVRGAITFTERLPLPENYGWNDDNDLRRLIERTGAIDGFDALIGERVPIQNTRHNLTIDIEQMNQRSSTRTHWLENPSKRDVNRFDSVLCLCLMAIPTLFVYFTAIGLMPMGVTLLAFATSVIGYQVTGDRLP